VAELQMYAGRYHLADLWTRSTRTFVARHVPKQIGACAFCSRRGGIPETQR
jgi:hypothetical protein